MKKELNKANKQLTLGKMTVAKLMLSQMQMRLVGGGNATTRNSRECTSLYDECTSLPCMWTGLNMAG